MNIEQIRENIKNRRYTASDPELDPIAYPNLHRLNPVQASPDERAAARAKLRQMGEDLRAQFRADLEEACEMVDHPMAESLWEVLWYKHRDAGLYEVASRYVAISEILR